MTTESRGLRLRLRLSVVSYLSFAAPIGGQGKAGLLDPCRATKLLGTKIPAIGVKNVVPARRLGIRSWSAPGAFTKPLTRKTLGWVRLPTWLLGVSELLAMPPAMAIRLPVPMLTFPWILAD